jgi:hypothetical protein
MGFNYKLSKARYKTLFIHSLLCLEVIEGMIDTDNDVYCRFRRAKPSRTSSNNTKRNDFAEKLFLKFLSKVDKYLDVYENTSNQDIQETPLSAFITNPPQSDHASIQSDDVLTNEVDAPDFQMPANTANRQHTARVEPSFIDEVEVIDKKISPKEPTPRISFHSLTDNLKNDMYMDSEANIPETISKPKSTRRTILKSNQSHENDDNIALSIPKFKNADVIAASKPEVKGDHNADAAGMKPNEIRPQQQLHTAATGTNRKVADQQSSSPTDSSLVGDTDAHSPKVAKRVKQQQTVTKASSQAANPPLSALPVKLDADLKEIIDKAMNDKILLENLVAEAQALAIKATTNHHSNRSQEGQADKTSQYDDTLMYSSTFPDDHTSISSVTISAPISTYQHPTNSAHISHHSRSKKNLDLSTSSPFQSLELDTRRPSPLADDASKWTDLESDSSLTPRKHNPPATILSPAKPKAMGKKKQKPLYLRIMEEAARKEALEHDQKEQAYKQVKSRKQRVNPSQEEIKEHMQWHDKLMNYQPSSPPPPHTKVITSKTKRSVSLSPRKQPQVKVKLEAESDSKSQGNSPIRVYLQSKRKRVRFKKKAVPKEEVDDSQEKIAKSAEGREDGLKLPSIVAEKKAPPSASKHENPRCNSNYRKMTPIKVRKPSISSPGRPISAGQLNDIDLSMFPHGPDWVSNLLRAHENEHKMAEIYEQSFAIMLLEHEAGLH